LPKSADGVQALGRPPPREASSLRPTPAIRASSTSPGAATFADTVSRGVSPPPAVRRSPGQTRRERPGRVSRLWDYAPTETHPLMRSGDIYGRWRSGAGSYFISLGRRGFVRRFGSCPKSFRSPLLVGCGAGTRAYTM